MAGRPAPLDGSLLARKGDAQPVIPDNSPLMNSVENATSEVVPLHRVEFAETETPAAPVVPSVVHTASTVSPRRRAAVILVALLVLGLIAVALAFREKGGAETGAVDGRAPERAAVDAETDAVPVPEAAEAMAPPDGEVAPPAAAPAPPSAATPVPPSAAPSAKPPPATPTKPPVAVVPPPAAAPVQTPVTATPALSPTTSTAPYVLQFASVRDERRASEEAARLQKRLGGIIGDRKIVVVGTEVRGRMTYRLRAGGFDSLRTAISTCRKVARLKVDCLPIRR